MKTREDRLFDRAEAILSNGANGFGEPILWHLALRGHGQAMLTIAGRMTYGGARHELGRVQDAFSPAGMITARSAMECPTPLRIWRSAGSTSAILPGIGTG